MHKIEGIGKTKNFLWRKCSKNVLVITNNDLNKKKPINAKRQVSCYQVPCRGKKKLLCSQKRQHAIPHPTTTYQYFLFISTSLHLRRAVMDFKKYKFFICLCVRVCVWDCANNKQQTHISWWRRWLKIILLWFSLLKRK